MSTISQILPIAPVIKQHHLKEQDELTDCNQRMNKYIGRVTDLENENTRLANELKDTINTWGANTRNVIKTNEPKLENARKAADLLSDDAAKTAAKANKLESEANFLQQAIADEISSSDHDHDKIKNLEQNLHQNKNELDSLKQAIDDRNDDLNKHAKNNDNLKGDLAGLLKALEEKNYECTKLRCENQTLEEQIPFLKSVNEKELGEMNRLFEGKHVDPPEFYRSELQRAINDIKNDFKDLNEAEKRDLEAWYKHKNEQLKQLDEKRQTNELPKIKELNKGIQATKSANTKEIDDLYQKQKELEEKHRALEDKLEDLRRDHNDKMYKKDGLIEDIKNEIADHYNDYDILLRNKGLNEFEINTFKRLLENSAGPETDKKIDSSLSNEELMRRLQREKAKVGDHHISIAWDNINDLDLHVVEPSGEEISFSHRKSASRGELDVDMNAGSQRSPEPCENIYWPSGQAPQGRYKVLVVYYSNHGGTDPTNYLVLVELNGVKKEYRGQMSYGDSPKIIEFDA